MPFKRMVTSANNPCNEFLIIYLLNSRKRNCHSAKDFKFFMYGKAIESIRKYPLPIICEQQLRMLAGIGDFLAMKLVNVIKEHYRKFLKVQNSQILTITSETIEEKIVTQHLNEKSQSQALSLFHQERDDSILQERDECPLPTDSICSQSIDKFSVRSEKLSVKSNDSKYKPKENSQGDITLKIMNQINAGERSVTIKDINDELLQKGEGKIKQWKTVKEKLLKHEYISCDIAADYQSFFITEKGQQFVHQTASKQLLKVTKKKIDSKIKLTKEKFEVEERIRNEESQNTQQTISCSKSKIEYSKGSLSSLSSGMDKIEGGGKLFLVIDNREVKCKEEDRNFFEEKLTNKYGVSCIKSNISLGDFIWIYQDKQGKKQMVLDYIIERKKADDLAASIIDGRYKEQKFRLKISGISNIIYLYEGHPSQASQKTEKQLNNALMKTRIYESFKVYKTQSINQSIKLLSQFHKQLEKKLKNDELEVVCPLQEYNKKYSKKNCLTLENVFGMGLKAIPSIGKGSIKSILKYFKTYRALYDALNEFETYDDRMQFLSKLLKGQRTQNASIKMIIQLLFEQ